MDQDLTATLWLKVTSTTNSEFTILSYGMISTTGLYNSTDSTIKICLQVWDQESNSSTTNYTLSSTFALNEWVYIGVSMYRTNRIEYLYDIHMVTRTLSGVENQVSYFSQSFSLECAESMSPITTQGYNHHSTDYYLGSMITSTKFMFTGLYNKIMIYQDPMTAIELLDNALRLPVKNSVTYEPDLLHNFIIYNDSTAEGVAHREEVIDQLSQNLDQTTITKIALEDSLSDPLNFCQFHTIEKECNFMDISQMYPVYHSESSFNANHNLLYNGVSSVNTQDGYLMALEAPLLKLCENFINSPIIVTWKSESPYKEARSFKFLYNATKEVFSIGSHLVETLVPKVYPDHGNSILHISESYSFEVTTRKYNLDEIEDKIEGSFDTEILAFALD